MLFREWRYYPGSKEKSGTWRKNYGPKLKMSSPQNSQVAVYLLATDVATPRTAKVMSLFTNPLFHVNVMNMSPPSNIGDNESLSKEEAISNYRILWCLKDAKTRHPDSHVIIVKDTSVSDASPDRIADIVSGAMSNNDWHLCYLSKWLDRCDLYSEKKPINGTMTVIAKTHSPHGMQAVMFSPHGRDVIRGEKPMKNGEYFSADKKAIHNAIHEAIMNGNLHATCAVPNLINFDTNAASRPSDYLKSHECELPPTQTTQPARSGEGGSMENEGKQMQQNPSQTNNNWIWWILVIIIIILILAGLYYWNRNRNRAIVV